MTTWITVCDNCKRPDWADRDTDVTDGTALAELLENACDTRADSDVRLRRHGCLMSCSSGCNVAIQADGKLSYTLGQFAPSDEAAQAILEYASLHAQSATGQVPYKQWPTPIKGHFLTRMPPLPKS